MAFKVVISLADIHKKINQKQIAPIYLLYGTESFFIEELKQKIINMVLSEEEKEFNYSIFDMSEIEVETAIEEAETLPFIGEKRVIILKNPLFLTSQRDKSKIEHDVKKFEMYIDNPSPDSIVIIIAPYEKLDERKKIVKKIKKNGEVFFAEKMTEQTVEKWVNEKIDELNLKITPYAKQVFVQLVGPNAMLLQKELQKLKLYAEDQLTIDEHVIHLLVARSIEQNIFTLINHVAKRKLADAIRVYYDLLEQKEEPVKIVILIARQFRIIYQVQALATKGYSQNHIASTLKLRPFQVRIAREQSKYFQDKELLTILDNLAEVDYQIKTGKIDKKLALELFLLKLNVKEIKKALF
jgi:DNA polymerase-3 subunit delta